MYESNHVNAGIWSLQHHDSTFDVNNRFHLGAWRVVEVGDQLEVVYDEDTVGDVVCARHWPVYKGSGPVTGSNTSSRPMPGWSWAWPAVATGMTEEADPTVTGPQGWTLRALPVNKTTYDPDDRFKGADHPWPDWRPHFPEGYLGICPAGVQEGEQSNLFYPADGRLIAVHRSEGGNLSTHVADLLDNRLLNKAEPGVDDISARLNTLVRVVRPEQIQRLDTDECNALAWYGSVTPQDDDRGFLGHCAFISRSTMADDGKTSDKGPVTGPDAQADAIEVPQAAGVPSLSAPLTIGLASHEAKGPFYPGLPKQDRHTIGATRDGESINSGKLSTEALFQVPGQQEYDAPLDFQMRQWDEGVDFPIITRVHLRYDAFDTHPWLGGNAPGLWKWQTSSPELPTSPPGPPPTTPPTDDDVPPTTPGDPVTPPRVPGGPITPGDRPARPTTGHDPDTAYQAVDQDELLRNYGLKRPGEPAPEDRHSVPPSESGTRGDGGNAPAVGAEGTPDREKKKGPSTKPKWGKVRGEDGRRYGRPKGPERGIREQPYGPSGPQRLRRDERGVPISTKTGKPLWTARNSARRPVQTYEWYDEDFYLWRPMNEGKGAILGIPQNVTREELDLRTSMGATEDEWREQMARRPVTSRLEPFGAEEGDDWDYTQRPRSSRYPGGTGNGGWVLLPPEVGLEDVGSDYAPSNRSLSTPYWTIGPGAQLGFGLPDNTTGDLQDCGWRMNRQVSNSESYLHFQGRRSGTWSDVMKLHKGAAGSEPDLVFGGADGIVLPSGATGDRSSSPTAGQIRWNTTLTQFEGYDGSSWAAIGGSSGIGGGTGSTDNALLRADGTGGSTAQGSDSTLSDAEVLNLGASTGRLQIDGTQVVGPQESAIADAGTPTSTAGAGTVDQTQVDTNFGIAYMKIDAILDALRAHGLIDT